MARGGARKGAGRKPASQPMRKMQVILTEREAQIVENAAERMGISNSEILRTIVEWAIASAKRNGSLLRF